jgi:hypothetical protein
MIWATPEGTIIDDKATADAIELTWGEILRRLGVNKNGSNMTELIPAEIATVLLKQAEYFYSELQEIKKAIQVCINDITYKDASWDDVIITGNVSRKLLDLYKAGVVEITESKILINKNKITAQEAMLAIKPISVSNHGKLEAFEQVMKMIDVDYAEWRKQLQSKSKRQNDKDNKRLQKHVRNETEKQRQNKTKLLCQRGTTAAQTCD